jgi:uncharacterized protein (DUF433 family)
MSFTGQVRWRRMAVYSIPVREQQYPLANGCETNDHNSEMQALEYPHLQKLSDGRARLTRVPRTRVSMIVTDYLGGWSADEILEQYPYLLPGEVYSALGYYFDHKEEIDAELTEEKARIEQLAAKARISQAGLRERLLARMKQAGG